MNILVVDDEQLIRKVIREYLENENYNVVEAGSGKKAIEEFKKTDIDLIIMDIMMPEMDGYKAIQEINNIKKVPVLMLSARNEEKDKLKGFELGIDDYVTKPFSPKELLARVKVILKRNKKDIKTFEYNTLKVDLKAHKVFISNKEVKLTPKEYELLVYFIDNKNDAISREQLLSDIWGYDFYGDDRTIDTHIKMLRNNLKQERDLIKTIRGTGYRFEVKEK